MSNKYSPSTRVGNWMEDIQNDELQLNDFFIRKQQGSLEVLKKQARLERSLRPMPTKLSIDGQLCYGDRIMLQSVASGGYLCGDADSSIMKSFGRCQSVTTATQSKSCGRSVYTLCPLDAKSSNESVRYGEPFHLMSDGLLDERLYLQSESLSVQSFARYSRKQEVYLSQVLQGDSIWEFVDPQGRLSSKGQLARIGDVCIRHVATGSLLASSLNFQVPTLLGKEFEVHCHPYISSNKVQCLISEKKGKTTGEHSLRSVGRENAWVVVAGPLDN